MPEDATHRIVRYLNDLYASEIGGLSSLKDLATNATDPDLKNAAQAHVATTENHIERLKARIAALGGDTSESKALVNTMIAKGSNYANAFHDAADKQTQDVIKAYAYEHFEIGAYTSLYTFATAVGDSITAQLAQDMIVDEREAAVQMERLIPQVAALALQNTTGTNTLIGNPTPPKSTPLIPPAVFLVPGALLAVWGVSRLLSAQNAPKAINGSDYRTNGDYVSSGEEGGEPEVIGIVSDYVVDDAALGSTTYVVSGIGVSATDPMSNGADLEG